jgi:phosphatidylserine/phosphatidylglycerophosphate/cardiolipin synthase-like enzyme
MAFLYNKAKEATQSLQDKAAQTQASMHIPSLADATGKFGLGTIVDGVNTALGFSDPALRYPHESSAPVTEGNNVKFHVAGCTYFWAVSEAIEKAKQSIWIQGCE